MNNLVQRVLVGLVGIPLSVLIIWAGGWWFSIAIVAITTAALWEFYQLAVSKNASANVSVGIAWSIVLQLTLIGALQLSGNTALVLMGVAVLVFVTGVVLTLMSEIWRARENAIVNTGITITGVAYITVCLSTLLFLRASPDPTLAGPFGTEGAALVLTLFIAVWTCDTVAYFTGKWIGKRKLFERISPKKTWEGAIGGGIASVVVFATVSYFLMPLFPIEHAVACGAIIGSFGQVGDLAESLLKRDATIKDSSHIIPGHGGVLDRFDSMLFASPLILIYLSVVSLLQAL